MMPRLMSGMGWSARTQTRSTPRLRQHYRLQIAVVGIAIGKNSFHIVGLDNRGAIVLRQKWSRG